MTIYVKEQTKPVLWRGNSVLVRRNLREMVANIDTASQQITGNVDGLKQVTETVDHMCSDNSATSQQLAAGMQETAATTVNINENVGTMKEGS